MPRIQRALLSVTNKTGIVDFARALNNLGVELVSTGGTAKVIREASIPVRDVSDLTGFPEIMDGRIKTLHPKVEGGILAMRNNPNHMAAVREHNIPLIDMVVVNLYAFQKIATKEGATVEELIENIDIGGPTMIRAAAKNWQDVAVVTSPQDYDNLSAEMISLSSGGEVLLSPETCWSLAKKAFDLTAQYDEAIAMRLGSISLTGGQFHDSWWDMEV